MVYLTSTVFFNDAPSLVVSDKLRSLDNEMFLPKYLATIRMQVTPQSIASGCL